ncbi:hypothetical protein BEP19_16860 [Ammoniphilus oxalaticus]|uniref:DUF3991 domain-containing protein n=1 Tax=Ammoniphilus oxalaticus TaxID=66863 RepID=A0A419SQ82_9BACL|nr:DUF3991 and TOPRIM domain-containing protein [Ammoniphilus oxalaticus]RKD26507.1 hypothetical protein BEP19_16860 [Ammoniphilus oxalaticus]
MKNKTGDRVSEKEIQKASDVHLLDYLQTKGEGLIQQGKYFRHAEHDSLVIRNDGKWFWNSRGEGGHGPISFARAFYNLSFQDAVRDVNQLSIDKTLTDDLKKASEQGFIYPKQYEADTQKHVRRYLVQERKIDPRLVDSLIKNGYLAEDQRKNCVFKWRDSKGDIVGADRQGTIRTSNGTFKQIAADSKEDGGFRVDVGTPNQIALFESPIDAISYYELFQLQNIRLQSMSGLKDRTANTAIKELIQECHARDERVEKVIFAVDNDEAGKGFAQRWKSLLTQADIHVPIHKDWNVDLQKRKEQQKKKEPVYEMER